MNLTLLTGWGPKTMVRAPFERFFLHSAALWWRHGTRMSDDDPDARRLADIEERLRKAREKRDEVRQVEAPNSKLGIAFRLVTELMAAVIVGGAIGWGLDRLLGTGPFLLIVMFMVGVAAGIYTVVRTAQRMNRDQAAKDARSSKRE